MGWVDDFIDFADYVVNNWVVGFVIARIPSVPSTLKKMPDTFQLGIVELEAAHS